MGSTTNLQPLRVALGPDVLSVKGAMVAFPVCSEHEQAGGVGKLLKMVIIDDPLGG